MYHFTKKYKGNASACENRVKTVKKRGSSKPSWKYTRALIAIPAPERTRTAMRMEVSCAFVRRIIAVICNEGTLV
jgi:hypothetical protein